MAVHKIVFILIAIYTGVACASTIAFEEMAGVVVRFVDPDEQTRLFYAKGLTFTPGALNTNGYMVTAQFFRNKGFYPVGIIVHNKSSEVIKISAQSVGSQQRCVDTILTQCCKYSVLETDIRVLAGICLFCMAYCSLLERGARGRVRADSIWSMVIGMPLTAVALSCYWRWHTQDNAAKVDALCEHMLSKEIIIKPGQKIIRYVLLDSCHNGINRKEFGVLDGLQFTVFNADGSPRIVCKAQVAS
jgi:hypothetical protein